MGTLYLLVTDHRDVHDGPMRFRAFCDRVRPTTVLSEKSAADFANVHALGSSLEQQLGNTALPASAVPRVLEEFYRLILPFPCFDTWQYAAQRGISHHFADLSHEPAVAFERAAEIAEDFATVAERTPERFTPALFQELRQSVHGTGVPPEYLARAWSHYLRTEGTVRNELTLCMLRYSGVLGKRDRHMEEVVRSAHAPDATTVFALGMVHATDSLMKTTLYSRIKDLAPKRILL